VDVEKIEAVKCYNRRFHSSSIFMGKAEPQTAISFSEQLIFHFLEDPLEERQLNLQPIL
jgi:hypothetical protein